MSRFLALLLLAGSAWGACSEFDFLAGNWKSVGKQDQAIAHTVRMHDGCLIEEKWHFEQAGKKLFDSVMLRSWDSDAKRWMLAYADDNGRWQTYEGRFERGAWRFYRERLADGKPIVVRITWVPGGKGYVQTIEKSEDRGATWKQSEQIEHAPM
ncbi:MAG: hypothetical protein ABI823_21255 [Bryobacteraceae bacterium]